MDLNTELTRRHSSRLAPARLPRSRRLLPSQGSHHGQGRNEVRHGVPVGAEAFNYIVGTQTIGATYQFTEESVLVETAQAILDMGSNLLKFTMGRATSA